MDGRRRVPREITINDARLYLTSVKKTFRHEPAKFKELLKVLSDFMAHRVKGANAIAKVEQILKDHQKLLLWFRVFLSKTNIINKGLDQFQTIIVGERVSPKETMEEYRDESLVYLASVKKAFHDEPAKYEEFFQIMKDFKAKRIDEYSSIFCMEELMKDHRDLLLGFSAFLPPGTQITIPPEADQPTVNNKRKRPNLKNKPKTKVQRSDTNRDLPSEKPLKVYTRQRRK